MSLSIDDPPNSRLFVVVGRNTNVSDLCLNLLDGACDCDDTHSHLRIRRVTSLGMFSSSLGRWYSWNIYATKVCRNFQQPQSQWLCLAGCKANIPLNMVGVGISLFSHRGFGRWKAWGSTQCQRDLQSSFKTSLTLYATMQATYRVAIWINIDYKAFQLTSASCGQFPGMLDFLCKVVPLLTIPLPAFIQVLLMWSMTKRLQPL